MKLIRSIDNKETGGSINALTTYYLEATHGRFNPLLQRRNEFVDKYFAYHEIKYLSTLLWIIIPYSHKHSLGMNAFSNTLNEDVSLERSI